MLVFAVCLMTLIGFASEERVATKVVKTNPEISDKPKTPLLLDFLLLDLPFGDRDICGLGIGIMPGVRMGTPKPPCVWGLQCGAVGNCARYMYGVQIGGILNEITLISRGVQLGAINFANSFGGVQIGLYNDVTVSQGVVQIGVINIIQDGAVPFMPIINMDF